MYSQSNAGARPPARKMTIPSQTDGAVMATIAMT